MFCHEGGEEDEEEGEEDGEEGDEECIEALCSSNFKMDPTL